MHTFTEANVPDSIDTSPVLAISSSVAVGHVGLSAIEPTLHLLGRTCAALPTTLLANHPGFARTAGIQTPPETLTAMVDAIDANGWLATFETVLTGYLPSAAHVEFAAATIARIRNHNRAARYVCDPVLGDDPKGLYIDGAAAAAIRDELIPLADVVLPNRFELAYLAGLPVTSPDETLRAARTLAPPQTIAKSIPLSDGRICNIDIAADTARSVTLLQRTGVPNGTGDMFSALIAAGWPMERASAALAAVIAESLAGDHLAIVTASETWRGASPMNADRIR